MRGMFYVRSGRALSPNLESDLPQACRLRFAAAPRPHSWPRCTSPRITCPPFDSSASDCVQPAAELQHVQCHGHAVHVFRALRACPGPQP
eukprot:scaffold94570_cov101-Phaeocystis_antarctica.AAC.3